MDLQQIRKAYAQTPFDEADAPEDPYPLLARWTDQAIESTPGEWCEPNAATLATCDAAGYVTARIVLVKGFDRHGLTFFTNYQSEKGHQLRANPRASLVLHWPYLGRQVRINGPVEATSAAESDAYFRSRPRRSQLAAHVSQQSRVVTSRAALEEAMRQLERHYADQPVPRPEHWGGYRLAPERFEFWQGRPDRLHDRIAYHRNEDHWERFRLAP